MNNYFLSENAKAIISGSVAGAVGYCSTLPLDYIKQHMQNNKSFSSIIQNTKSRCYFNGGLIGLSTIAPQMAIKYFCFHNFNKIFDHKQLSAFCAGIVDGAFLGPVLSAQSLQQINTNLSYQQSFRLLKGQSLFQLSIPMALRNALYTSSLLGGYRMIPDKKKTFGQDLFYASLLNIPGTIVCSPADVLRAKQNEFLLNNKNINVVYVCKEIYNKDGFSGFFRGYRMLYINFAIRFPFTLATFNYLMREY